MAMVATVKEHRYRELFINVIPKHHHQHVGILSFRRNATTSHSDWFRWFSACWHWKSMPRPRDGFSRSTFRTRSRGEHTHTHTDTAIAKVRALARKTTNEWRLQKKANTHKKQQQQHSEWRKEAKKKKWAETKIPEFWNSKKPVFISAFGHSLFVRLRSRLKLFLHAVTRCRRYDTRTKYCRRLCWCFSAEVSLLHWHTNTPHIVFARPFKYCLYLLLFTYI